MTTTTSSKQQEAPALRSIDQSKIAYQKPQPLGMVPDVFVGSALELAGTSASGSRSRRPSRSGHSC
jgi:hypothetical protein